MSSTVFASTRVARRVARARRATKHRRARPDPRVPREFRSLRAPALEGTVAPRSTGREPEGAPSVERAPGDRHADPARSRRVNLTRGRRLRARQRRPGADVLGRGRRRERHGRPRDRDGARQRRPTGTRGGSVLGAMEESPMSSTTAAIDAAEAAVPLKIIGGNRPAVARDDALPDGIVVANGFDRYVDETSGYSVAVPAGWARGSARGEHPRVSSRVRVRRQEVRGDGDARGESSRADRCRRAPRIRIRRRSKAEGSSRRRRTPPRSFEVRAPLEVPPRRRRRGSTPRRRSSTRGCPRTGCTITTRFVPRGCTVSVFEALRARRSPGRRAGRGSSGGGTWCRWWRRCRRIRPRRRITSCSGAWWNPSGFSTINSTSNSAPVY